MGKLDNFEIVLENSILYAGAILQGQVIVDLKEPMKMRGIQLTFEGKAKVHWTEQHTTSTGKTTTTVTRHYSASESYFNQDVLLFGKWSKQGSDTTELAAGRHTFPFQFQLPQKLPSSYESKIGHVRYVVKSRIDKPWKFDHKCKKAFTVISILDLNSQPEYARRLQSANTKHFCCLCCKSGPIEASFHVDRKGYVPGEAIILNAEISNGSSRKMAKSYVDLKMITSYHATSKTRKVTKEIARVTRPGIEGHREDVWNGEQLVIPPVPPSFLVGCKIIDIQYILQLNVDPTGPGLDLEVPLEVVIGTIPLMSVVQQHPPLPPPDGGYGGWAIPSAPPPGALYPPDMPNMPPPAYSECVTGKVDIHDDDDNEHTRGDLNFAPAYTYYNWGHTPSPVPEK